jgi:predicted dehydrogenase
MSRQHRRDFLKRTAAGGLALASLATSGMTKKSYARVLGANDRVRIAVAGINSRGLVHISEYCKMKDVEIAYLVDPDSRLFAEREKWIKDHSSSSPQCVQDLRRILDDKNLDALSIASPNFWHALQAIWACRAGKDVYVEKPCCHNIFEGRKLVEAARKHDRIVQQGSQARSSPIWIRQIEAIRGGKFGKLLVAYGYASKPRESIGFKLNKEPPKELDFNIWLGPAPQQPYHENIVHYNWHWFWDFGNGEIGNQGVHQMDIARWAMPDGAAPKSVLSAGGRYGYQPQDQGQTPNTQLTVIDFGGPKIIFEDRGLVDAKTTKVDNEFLTTEGRIRGNKFFPNGKSEPVVLDNRKPGNIAFDHFKNFIECVRSRKRENLHAEIEEGFRSAMLCHLGNISYRLGKEERFGHSVPEGFAGEPLVEESFESLRKHLIEAVHLNPKTTACQIGRKLAFDAATERFDDEEANALLTRHYREPFVVPDVV